MNLPVHGFPVLLILFFVGIGFVGVLGTFAGYVYGHATRWWPFRDKSSNAEYRHCRYCYFGRAKLHEESARVEGLDLVEVKCFVCGACGLPQWSVQRSPVLRRAA